MCVCACIGWIKQISPASMSQKKFWCVLRQMDVWHLAGADSTEELWIPVQVHGDLAAASKGSRGQRYHTRAHSLFLSCSTCNLFKTYWFLLLIEEYVFLHPVTVVGESLEV